MPQSSSEAGGLFFCLTISEVMYNPKPLHPSGVLLQQPDLLLYFAYGSNMNSADLKNWCKGKKAIINLTNPRAAVLKDFKVAFTHKSESRKGGVADIVRAEGEEVWGVLFETDESSLKWIDKKEGWIGDLASSVYKRVRVEVFLDGEKPIEAMTYEVIRKGSYKPSQEYLEVILKGAEDHQLPRDYVDKMRKLYS
jgi:gamma-glutamylcyclotransferase